MSKIECPYCEHIYKIDIDVGDYDDEDELYEKECPECLKKFVITMEITIDYRSYKADCLNGSAHKYEPVCHQPRHWPDWIRCADCGDETKGRFDDLGMGNGERKNNEC